VIRQSFKGRKTPHPLTKDVILWHTGSNVIGFFRNSNQKGRKTPHPLTKDAILWHTGSNVIGFVFRNNNQKGGKITCL